jgi:2-polyprenyl-3-methyl-5-hydroxy-6-metoxy-1,4-benzoquinol methylase
MRDRNGRTLRQLVSDRWSKQGLYNSPEYWNMKAERYSGLARSNWPSNTYNEQLHARQMDIVDRLLGEVRGLALAEVGCGTGRASLHLARRGANVFGFDFSEQALAVARADADAAGVSARFEVANVLSTPAAAHRHEFDVVLSLGCLTLACTDAADFERALDNLLSLLRPGGRLLFVEPMHASRLLRRILRMTAVEWTERCRARNLEVLDRGGLLFVPTRFVLAFRDLPEAVVAPLFRAGEHVLALSPRLERLADYKWLLLAAPTAPAGPHLDG